MKDGSWQFKATMCVAVLGLGCGDETYITDEAPEAPIYEESEDSEDESYDVVDDGVARGVVGFETLDVTLPASLHAQGLALPAKLVRPKWSEDVGEQPAMLVLHGSGGLLKMPEMEDDDPCSSTMEPQFKRWSERLAKLGYTVLLPSSYSARGFCDTHEDTARMPKTFDEKPEQIISRLYDVDASARYLCALPEVDCKRMGVLGFSQGGTMTMLAVHWNIEHAIAYFRATKGGGLDIPIPDVKPGRPEFQVGIAYYPGCGFDGVVPLSTKGASVANKFFSAPPLYVLHGGEDPLVEHCAKGFGPGEREIQSAQVAAYVKTANTYHRTVYPTAGHGFDNAKGTTSSDAKARDAALAIALDAIATHVQ